MPTVGNGQWNAETLRRELAALRLGLQFKNNTRRLISLRGSPEEGGVLSLHPLLVGYPESTGLLIRYVCSSGRGRHERLRRMVREVGERITRIEPAAFCFEALLGHAQRAMLHRLHDTLRRHTVELELNDNRRTLVSLRHGKRRQLHLSIHYQLLDYEEIADEVVRFARRNGRGRYVQLGRAMDQVFEEIQRRRRAVRPAEPPVQELTLQPIGPQFSLANMARHVHQTWFSSLPMPLVRWSRDPGADRHLSCIRFGSYRSHPSYEIRIHPRLRQTWVAAIFLEHVLHHEFCHHAQGCAPRRREKPHSPRFKRWERSYPHYDLACRWERLNLDRLLAPECEQAAEPDELLRPACYQAQPPRPASRSATAGGQADPASTIEQLRIDFDGDC